MSLKRKHNRKTKALNHKPLPPLKAIPSPTLIARAQAHLLLQLKLKRMILTALAAVESTNPSETGHLALAHVVRPAVDRPPGEGAVVAEFNAVAQHVVVAPAVVLDVGVGAHRALLLSILFCAVLVGKLVRNFDGE